MTSTLRVRLCHAAPYNNKDDLTYCGNHIRLQDSLFTWTTRVKIYLLELTNNIDQQLQRSNIQIKEPCDMFTQYTVFWGHSDG